jgi:hypothetical protein
LRITILLNNIHASDGSETKSAISAQMDRRECAGSRASGCARRATGRSTRSSPSVDVPKAMIPISDFP